MDQALSITLALAALATVVLVVRMILATRRRKRELKRRFRDEYERLLREGADRERVVRKLEHKKRAG